MDISYCGECCKKGKEASDRFLNTNNSAFDAALDFQDFVHKCFKDCPYKDRHN